MPLYANYVERPSIAQNSRTLANGLAFQLQTNSASTDEEKEKFIRNSGL